MCQINNVHLTIFLNGSDHAEYTRKADLQKMKLNATKFMQTKINFVLGKNGGHRPCILGSRLIVVVSKLDEMLEIFENFEI